MRWIEIRAVLSEEPDDWSPWIDLFDRYGCENTLQTDAPPSLTACVVDVEGAQARVDKLREALQEAGVQEVQTHPLEEVNWDEHWKQFFKPRRIGERIVVRPTWEDFEAQPHDAVIVLDPGQAFGTGDHPTTRMCLELLEVLNPKGKEILDLGCGSGILSIAACLLGAKRLAGIDIDPISVEVAKENARLNGVSFEAVAGDSLHAVSAPAGGWDGVLSNIISATLIRFAGDVYDALKPGGDWLVSGIIEANWPDVQAAAIREGFTLEGERREDGWVAAIFRR